MSNPVRQVGADYAEFAEWVWENYPEIIEEYEGGAE
jgi:hypothetical protein